MAQYTHTRKDLTYRLLEQLKLLHFIGVSVSRDVRRINRREWSFITHGLSQNATEKYAELPSLSVSTTLRSLPSQAPFDERQIDPSPLPKESIVFQV